MIHESKLNDRSINSPLVERHFREVSMKQNSSQHNNAALRTALSLLLALAAVLAFSLSSFASSSGKSGAAAVTAATQTGPEAKPNRESSQKPTVTTGNHVRIRRPPPVVIPGAGSVNLTGTAWRGPDFDDNLTRTFEFLPGGNLKMTGQDGTVYYGTWSMTGANRFHIDINGYTREGTIAGNVINGTGLVSGRPFTWRATRISGAGGGGTTAASVEGSTWDWRDSNDHGYVYEYLPGGSLRATDTRNGQVITNCRWSQQGTTVTMTFEAGAREQGAVSGSQMGGTGQSGPGGEQYTWTANKITDTVNRGTADSLEGTAWRGPDHDDDLTRTFEFLSGGNLKMTGQDGTVYNGQWRQSGNLFHIDINGYTREGLIIGRHIKGSGFVSGRPFSWDADYLGRASGGGVGGGVGSGGTTTGTLLGTRWRGPDFDDNLVRTYDFNPGGDLKMVGQDGTEYHGTWSQVGNRLHIDINGYTREGVVNGNTIEGTGVVQGRPFTWRATRLDSGGGGGGGGNPSGGSLTNTAWRGPDYDDNIVRTFEFLPGGDLRLTNPDGTVYHGQWTQTGSRFHIEINSYTRDGVVNGDVIEGTGIVQGRPFTWRATRLGSGIGVGGGTQAGSIVGTTWRGPDYDDNLVRTFEFQSGGSLRMTGQDGTVYNGTWSQSGNRIHIDINGYTREATIQGNHLDGTGMVQGRPFTWSAERVGSAASLVGTRWRGPDFDDNLVRTYEFRPGGALRMIGQDGTSYNGTWTQNGNALHIDINGYTREGVINGNTIEGTGLVQGRPFTWRATRLSGSGGGGGGVSSIQSGNIVDAVWHSPVSNGDNLIGTSVSLTGGSLPMMAQAGSLVGTRWRGPDYDDNLVRTYDFLSGGNLRMTGQDGTVYHGTWWQRGNRIHIDINDYTRDATIQGNHLDGTGVVQGRRFSWSAERVVSTPSMVGTRWRGPDYDDNLVRTYNFLARGRLRMVGQDGTVYFGTWTQSGNRIHIDINNYTREATIQGNHLEGTGVVQGRPFTWSATRIN